MAPRFSKRLYEAREQGNVPRSRELATCSILLAASGAFRILGDKLVAQIGSLLKSNSVIERKHAFDIDLLVFRAVGLLLDVLLAFAPLAGLLMLAGIGAPPLIDGRNFGTKAFMPDFEKLNLLSGLARMVSTHALIELGKRAVQEMQLGFVGPCHTNASIWQKGVQDEKKSTALMRLTFLSVLLAAVQLGCAISHSTNSTSTLMKRYGLEGTWSPDCAASGEKKIRTIYNLSVVGAPRIETYADGNLVSSGDVLAFECLSNNRHRFFRDICLLIVPALSGV